MTWEKKTCCLWLLDKLKRENTLILDEYECLTSVKPVELVYYAAEHAAEVRKKVYGNEVYIEWLIEIGNSCLIMKGNSKNRKPIRLYRSEKNRIVSELKRAVFDRRVVQARFWNVPAFVI